MKINKAQADNIRETIRKEEFKKDGNARKPGNAAGNGEAFVRNEAMPRNLKNYSITREESESLMSSVRKSLSEMSLNIDDILSNLKNENVFSVLKENN